LYGSHLSQEVIDSMIAPKDESRELLMQWLDGEGLVDHVSLSPRLDSVIVQASISQIEKLLSAEYRAFGEIFSNPTSTFKTKVWPQNNLTVIQPYDSSNRFRAVCCANSRIQHSRHSERSRGYGSTDDILRPQTTKVWPSSFR
jgi:hypothetical protein